MVFKPKTKQQNPKDDVLQKYVLTHLNTQVTVSLMNSLRGIRTTRTLPFRRTLPYTTLKEIKMPKKLSLSESGKCCESSPEFSDECCILNISEWLW